jgi:glutamyl-tRNA synthetase
MEIRTRMAPSPTGEYHVGHLATLLKNYAFAKGNKGKFILRIEDTDQTRKVEGAVEKILEVIKAYGLSWDEGPDVGGDYGPYVQSQRLELYKEKALELVEKGKAYYCFCSKERLDKIRDEQRKNKIPPKYDGYCKNLSKQEIQKKLEAGESYVIRLNVPKNREIVYHDLIRGEIKVNSDILDEQVLLKSDGFPTYHLAVVVDDTLMKITHIMRGEEWLSSTPKHILLYEAFGLTPPIYAHVPIFLNPDGKGKMSKRKGTVSAISFLEKGYLPEAMLNFFMILGWARKDEREIMTLDEYVEEFNPKKISAKSVVFDLKKLAWLNGVYIRNLSNEDLKNRLKSFIPADFPQEKLDEILILVKERLVILSDFEELTSFFYRDFIIDEDLKKSVLKKADFDLVKLQLEKTTEVLNKQTSFDLKFVENSIRQLCEKEEYQKSQYFMMLRLAITGRKATPPLFETMMALGKEKVLSRFREILASL